MSNKYVPSKGDWVCSDSRCGNMNFARRDKCNKCGNPKKISFDHREIGKEGAHKSKGLFSADDWQCKSCGNINWARRSTCNVCNTPRLQTGGQRTGYGGGYMEREEVVEYKTRDESDDEYDEIGRKKKKFRRGQGDDAVEGSYKRSDSEDDSTGSPSTKRPRKGDHNVSSSTDRASQDVANERQESQDDEVEDEEEESGDDEDLAKYDIWGGSNDEEGAEDQETEANENSAGKTEAKGTEDGQNKADKSEANEEDDVDEEADELEGERGENVQGRSSDEGDDASSSSSSSSSSESSSSSSSSGASSPTSEKKKET